MEEKLVDSIYKSVVEENLELYDEILNTPLSEVTDEYWKNVIMLYNKSDKADRKVIKKIFRQVIVDTVSTFLGILDGGSTLSDFEHEIKLTIDDNEIEESLQDMFLELSEE